MDGTTQLLESDRRYLVHPLHHPDDHRQPLVVVEGKGAILRDAEGREYIDGLSGLWNVNVGHGRGELAKAVVDCAGVGVCTSDYDQLQFTKVRRPIYPLDLPNR
jgi:adenosylmethionine-8-amino-7-oxononanoate aminotransferase